MVWRVSGLADVMPAAVSLVFCRWSSCWCFAGGRLVGVLPAVASLVFCRRPSCRCPFASTAGLPAVGAPLCRCFAAVECNLGLGLETCASAEIPKGHLAIPRDGEGRSDRASAKKHGPFRIVQFLWPRVLWFGKSAHRTGACLILRDPNQFATRREAIFIARKHYFAAYLLLLSVRFCSAAEVRRRGASIVIVV